MRNRAWLVFAVFFCWKVVLLFVAAEPVPANDAFFYDGAVVHQLLHGGYYNPSLTEAFPILGTQVFSAYPPLHQVALRGWMSIFGVSAFSAMAMHVFLIGIYLLVMLGIFRRLLTPVWCQQIGGTFLFLITFHDRPDTLAHVFGMLTVYAWVRARPILSGKTVFDVRGQWTWLMVLFSLLTFCTSLQIGTVYFCWVWLGTAVACYFSGERFPMIPLAVNLIVPVTLAVIVKQGFPAVWAGFQENVQQTNFLSGLRMPELSEVAKVIRTAPGVLLTAVFLPAAFLKCRANYQTVAGIRNLMVLAPGLLGAAGIAIASLFVLASNTVGTITCYLQPLVVICFLAVSGTVFAEQRWRRAQTTLLMLAMLAGSVRAIGMSTWGLACAQDVSYWKAIDRVRHELDKDAPGSVVVVSSAFLYEAARHDGIKAIHSDWLKPAHDPANHTAEGLIADKPAQLILTQFDYYRRFEALLTEAKSDPALADVKVENLATVRPPDAIKSLRQVIQHISWAPVIVKMTWK